MNGRGFRDGMLVAKSGAAGLSQPVKLYHNKPLYIQGRVVSVTRSRRPFAPFGKSNQIPPHFFQLAFSQGAPWHRLQMGRLREDLF